MPNSEVLLKEIEKLKSEKSKIINEYQKKELFFASMIHEIRTPTNAILGLSEILSQSELDNDQKSYMYDIKSSGMILSNLVNDLLNFSKLESGHFEIDNKKFNLLEMLESVMNMFKFQLKEKHLQFKFKLDKTIPPMIIGDSLRISQVLINLIGNAVKFTENGSILLQVKQVFKNSEKQRFEFSVIDTGIGIKKNKLTKIFENFAQADSSITQQYGGTGLGLSISRQLVEAMHGKISVESNFGRGSSFIFYIENEITKSIADETPLFSEDQTFIKKNLIKKLQLVKNKQILLVEDNEINQMIVLSFLKKTDIKVVVVPSAEDALEIMENLGDEIDLILMDIKLPDMDGYEATRQLRQKEKYNNLPIISFSANRKEDDKDKASKFGMNEIVTKPMNIVHFYSILLKYLAD